MNCKFTLHTHSGKVDIYRPVTIPPNADLSRFWPMVCGAVRAKFEATTKIPVTKVEWVIVGAGDEPAPAPVITKKYPVALEMCEWARSKLASAYMLKEQSITSGAGVRA